jgi:hypothetical protein
MCRGRDQLAYWVGRDSGWRIPPELEELVFFGERVLVVTHSPGIDERRARKTGDRNFHVVTVRDNRITALRACRNRDEAEAFASTPTTPPAIALTREQEAAAMSRLAAAIKAGDVDAVGDLLADHPELAAMRQGGENGKTALHIATDWPGFFPNAPAIVELLIRHRADPDARAGRNETPLHWAASSGDVEVAAVLVSGGADIDAAEGSIGTPVENAVGYGCFDVARLLVAHGAGVETLWVAAALACGGVSTSSSRPRRSVRTNSMRPSGTRAPAGSGGSPSTSTSSGPTSMRRPATATSQRSTGSQRSTPSASRSSDG